MKTKIPPRKRIVSMLDTAFSKFVRLRGARRVDTVQGGSVLINKCCTCGRWLPITQMDAGHYISRGKYPTRWSEDNVHPQCKQCNIFMHGNYTQYALYMIRTYGYSKLSGLDRRSKQSTKVSTVELYEKVQYYKDKAKAIEGSLR